MAVLLDMDNLEVRKEVALILTNVAVGESTIVRMIRNTGAQYKLLSLLATNNIELKERVC